MSLSPQEKTTALKNWLAKTFIDPTVTKVTLGEELSSVSPRTLLKTSEKLIKVNKKEIEPDDRDSLRFSTFLGLEDFIKDHIEKDAGGLRRAAAKKMQQRKNLSWLTSSYFTPQIRSVVIGNSLSNGVDGINPMEHLDNAHRVTKMGEGGIAGSESIPKECFDADTEVLTGEGWKFWRNVTEETELACLLDGKIKFRKPIKLIRQEYDGTMYGIKTELSDVLVTPNHRMWVRELGSNEWKFVLAEDCYNRSMEVLAVSTSPLKENSDGRSIVASASIIPEMIDNNRMHHYKMRYVGPVYCAQVPGELLLVRRNKAVPIWTGNSRQINTSSFGFFDPLHIAESDKIGVTQYIANNTLKGRDNKLYKYVKDKNGNTKWVDHETLLDSTVKIPEI